MSSTLDNPPDRPREGDDADQERWEQNFRDARPELPEEAMTRIEASLRTEMERAVAGRRRSPVAWRIAILAVIAVALIVTAIRLPVWIRQRSRSAVGQNQTQYQVEDRYPVAVAIGPELVAPDRPILPLDEYPDLLGIGSTPVTQPAEISVEDQRLLNFASALEPKLERPDNSLHAKLGLWDLHRVMEHRGPDDLDANSLPRGLYGDVAWNLLPLQEKSTQAFASKVDEMRKVPFFWGAVYTLCLAEHRNDEALAAQALFGAEPKHLQFPSKDCDWARFDLLNVTGQTQAQAGLMVLTTRSYRPLRALAAMDRWPGAKASRERLYSGYLKASRDLVESIFSLRMAGRDSEATELLAKARKLTYLNDPRDLAILLARLGPDEAWSKLVGPLMNDELAFVRNPPNFATLGPRPQGQLSVSALTKIVQEGVTNYAGDVHVNVGPWRFACDKVKVFRDANGGTVLTASDHVQITGVYGFLSIACDEFTFNAETGDLKLTGSVQLQGAADLISAKSAKITRTCELIDVKR